MTTLLERLETHGKKHCILMFSGGRDSSLAAVQLHEEGYELTLLTVASDHLTGVQAVKRRLHELKHHLPSSTKWLLIKQPKELLTDVSFYEQTCLPCHHAYVVIASALAVSLRARFLAFGYVGYQNGWPEQTPLATARLGSLLAKYGTELLLPVYDLGSKEAVLRKLAEAGLSTESLEQKCSRQVTNVELSQELLEQQISLWEGAIEHSIRQLGAIHIAELEKSTLGEIA